MKFILLIAYFAVMVGIGLYCRKNATDVNGFVLGGRSVGPWLTAFAYGTSYFSVAGASDRELFDFYTDRRSDHGSFEETKKFLRDAQSFLGCEILTLIDFLKERGLLYAYLRYKYPEPLTEEDELPF